VFNVFPSRSTAPTNCCALPSQPSRRNLDGVADRGRGREGGRGRRKAPPGKKNYMFAVRRTAQAGHPDEEEERSSCFLLSFSFLSSSLTSALVPQEYFSLSLSLSWSSLFSNRLSLQSGTRSAEIRSSREIFEIVEISVSIPRMVEGSVKASSVEKHDTRQKE